MSEEGTIQERQVPEGVPYAFVSIPDEVWKREGEWLWLLEKGEWKPVLSRFMVGNEPVRLLDKEEE